MPVDVTNTNKQLARLATQMDRLRYAESLLCQYEDQLSAAWRSEERRFFDKTAEGLIRQCRCLEQDLEGLRGSVRGAMEDILQEEREEMECF